jgi:fibronectin-binding autotransporter adhesin
LQWKHLLLESQHIQFRRRIVNTKLLRIFIEKDMKKTYTQKMKVSAGCCLLAGLLTSNLTGASSQYFGVTAGIANNGSYSWDANNWSVVGGTSTGPFTSPWTAGSFARFYGGPGDTYTVTVNAAESMAGLYDDNTGAPNNLIINNGGSGSLSVVAGTAVTQNGYSWLPQGFLTAANTVTINASITGSGGVEEESGGGHLQMYGNNSFTGGYLVSSSSTFNDYNNANSFGNTTSSQIGFDGTTFAIMNNTGSSSLVIANPVQTIGNTGVNFIGNGVTYTGNWYLGGGASAINIRNNGVGTTVTLSGVMSATSGAVTFSGANAGTIVLGGQNTYTGSTTVGVSGDTSITLAMGVNNAIANSSSLILAGGTFAANGYNQSLHTLGLTATSTMSFLTGTEQLTFANSSGVSWTAGQKLNLTGYAMIAGTGQSDGDLYVGVGGLTSGQLADITIDGESGAYITQAGDALGAGYVEVPEPSTLALGAMGGLGMLWMIKRRKIA